MFNESKCEYMSVYSENIAQSIIAFANTDGGTIYIGINDDGSVCGVDDFDEVILSVTNLIRDGIRPDVTMCTECIHEIREGKDIVVVNVQRGVSRPYYLRAKGVRPEGVFVRQGASSVPASETAILTMIKESCKDSYEQEISLMQDLTFDYAEEYFLKRGVVFGESQKRTMRLIGEGASYTNLGFLLSDQCTHMTKVAVFKGSDSLQFRERREYSGCILKQLEDVYSFLEFINQTSSSFEGLRRIDVRDYPAAALREALMNALVHRDYSLSAPTLVSVFENRIEIVNVGGLVKGINLEDISMGVSLLRNEGLANVFYRLELIEAFGTGIRRIHESYATCIKKPKIEISPNAFKITLPNVFYDQADFDLKPDDSRMNEVLKLLKDKETIARKDVDELLDISQSTSSILLREMLKEGLIVKEGSGRNLRYRRASHPSH